MDDGVNIGDDGLGRCPWGLQPDEYRAYHDEEWGRPVVDEAGLFERLCLEAFQSGLSWLTILRKRHAFRSAFAGFDPAVVAGFGPADVARLLGDPGIVRNRRKIEATITNARAVLDLWEDGERLAGMIWRHKPEPPANPPRKLSELSPSTPESQALADELRRRGFRFLGPTSVYAAMQAIGLVNDHLLGCHARPECERLRGAPRA